MAERLDDADARALRRASRAVGAQIAVTSSLLVLGVLLAALFFVFSHIKPARLFDFHRHESTIDVGGVDILVGGLVIGVAAIVLAGTMSWFATRRAVRPLGDALRAQRAFVADASHELRTPLTVLDARLQALQRGLSESDASQETVAELRRDAKTLIDIVNDLLAAAEVGGSRPHPSEPVPLGPVVTLAVDSMRLLATERSVSIELDAPEPLATPLPAGSIHRCVVALLDNALGYSPSGSTIVLRITGTRHHVILSVRDQGPGIQGIAPERIFDRFARSGSADGGGGTTRAGFGIGLSLVRDTVERYGGRAAVASTSDDGTEIELVLPRARLK